MLIAAGWLHSRPEIVSSFVTAQASLTNGGSMAKLQMNSGALLE
jgi:hypothetical protein